MLSRRQLAPWASSAASATALSQLRRSENAEAFVCPTTNAQPALRRIQHHLVCPEEAAMADRLVSIGVFCGSSPGLDPAYADTAASLGRNLARRGLRLVYGGGASA